MALPHFNLQVLGSIIQIFVDVSPVVDQESTVINGTLVGSWYMFNFFLFGKVACEEASKRHPDFQFWAAEFKKRGVDFLFCWLVLELLI